MKTQKEIREIVAKDSKAYYLGAERTCFLEGAETVLREFDSPSDVQSCKTLQEVKDEVARKRGYENWANLCLKNDISNDSLYDEIASQFHSSSKEWISVESALPEKNGFYLCAVSDKYDTEDPVRMFAWEDDHFEEWINTPNKDVTHWMNLPEPPNIS